MKITRFKLRQIIREMSDPEPNPGDEYLVKIKSILDGDPTLENINQMAILAADVEVDMNKFREIAYPAFKKAVDNTSNVSVDDVKSFYEIGNSLGFDASQLKPIISSSILKAVQGYSKPTIQDIKDLYDLAKSMNLDLNQIRSIVMGMTERANVLEQVNVDNIVYEIDDILFRARDVGLQSLGLRQRVDTLEQTGQLSEDEVYDTDIELINSVKDVALKAIERSMAQIILGLLK